MSISSLTPGALRVAIAPEILGFANTSELLKLSPPRVGQASELAAARLRSGHGAIGLQAVCFGRAR